METQQRGSLCISFIIFAFFPPLDGVNKQAQVQAATAEFTGSAYKFSSHEYRNNS